MSDAAPIEVAAPDEDRPPCECEDSMRSACKGQPFYQEDEGKRYCVLHFPSKDKTADFNEVLKLKLNSQDYDFTGVWFPDTLALENFEFSEEANFIQAHFTGEANFMRAVFKKKVNFREAAFAERADFSDSTFHDATFVAAVFRRPTYFIETRFNGEVSFASATFMAVTYFSPTTFNEGVSFNLVSFQAASSFSYATFNGVPDFRNASFKGAAYFSSSTFSQAADFRDATFEQEADFRYTTFNDYLRFSGRDGERGGFGNSSALDLQYARAEKPDRVSFHTVVLYPHSFVNVDPRSFIFTNVEWQGSIAQETKKLEDKGVSPSHRLLAIAYQQLAVNAENNNRYDEASRFRYLSMEARRLDRFHGFAFWTLAWWYWLLSGYGEKVLKASIALLAILALFTVLYTHVGFAQPAGAVPYDQDRLGEPLEPSRAALYSLGVITLQKPEPRPVTTAARFLVILESVLGPAQAALLLLAIRRKFMR